MNESRSKKQISEIKRLAKGGVTRVQRKRTAPLSRYVINLTAKTSTPAVIIPRRISPVARMLQRVQRRLSSRKTFTRLTAIAVALSVASLPLITAFEGHVVNVTATIIMIEPPVITPPGGNYTDPINLTIDDDDPDATHVFYTVTPGLDPNIAPDPVCGISAGGPKPVGPIPLSDDAVVKAIACDSGLPGAHESLITTEIYDFAQTKGKIQGYKYHDLDQSESFTPGDFGVEGWQIQLLDGDTLDVIAVTVTDANGYYQFTGLDPAGYIVKEETRIGWQHLTPESVAVTIDDIETEVVDFLNFDTGFACAANFAAFPDQLAVQAAGVTNGNDDVTFGPSVVVNGNVRSNDEIEAFGGGSGREINGSAFAKNTIDPSITVSGTTLTNIPATTLPNISIPFWKARAQDGGTINGHLIFPDNTVGLELGPAEIMGNVEFGANNSAVIDGPLYIHGNLAIGSNTVIAQDPAFGDSFVTIIVDGAIDIAAGASFSGSGVVGAILLVSTSGAITGDDAAIEAAADASDIGEAVLFASEGDIHINGSRTLLAAFAKAGTGNDLDANTAIRFDSGVTVNYRALPNQIACGEVQPYDSTTHVLINEFVPNPTGDDQGTGGGALDGEWVELFNPTGFSVDVAGYVLYDSSNDNELVISGAITDTGSTIIPSHGFLVVYRDGDDDFELENTGGDTVRLFSNEIGAGGLLIDSHAYTQDAPENKSFARIPDGAANWVDPDPTPGAANNYFYRPLEVMQPWQTPFQPSGEKLTTIVQPVLVDAVDIPVEEPLPLEVRRPEPEPEEEAIETPAPASESAPADEDPAAPADENDSQATNTDASEEPAVDGGVADEPEASSEPEPAAQTPAPTPEEQSDATPDSSTTETPSETPVAEPEEPAEAPVPDPAEAPPPPMDPAPADPSPEAPVPEPVPTPPPSDAPATE
ncbi:hypothetical protein C4552_04120 [Candidatus Parcubacteria bacterium]|nr:MAG: hypothetical protein C4552_04120 [Candidatus Parcubacteria bacterium]